MTAPIGGRSHGHRSTPLLASRVRKARRAGTCALCRAAITIGQRIGLLPSGQWAHIRCIVATSTRNQEDR